MADGMACGTFALTSWWRCDDDPGSLYLIRFPPEGNAGFVSFRRLI